MQADSTQSFVIVGRVSRPFGIKGWNHLTSFTDPPQNLLQYRPWALCHEHDSHTNWRILDEFDTQINGNGMLLRIEQCTDRDAANKFVQCFIGVPRAVLPVLSEDEHYWVDLIGTDVISLEQEQLGVVEDVSWNGAHPILIVSRNDAAEMMIPLVSEYVRNVEAGHTIEVYWSPDWV